MTTAPSTVLARFLDEVLNGTRLESLPELVHSQPLRRRVEAFRTAFPDLRVTVHQLVVDGRFAAVHFSGSGTHIGTFHGVPATGRSWSSTCTALFEIDDRGIVDFWMNWDMLDILEQLRVVRRAAGASA
jgi:predicted ester cyclase